ncbi:MAG: polysaccharide biosynthesis C-terminal domain-containing protein, partial [Thermodesulfobacteriota bacterium]|nr:polysaccharide biosynthesis C-terminal domain-containing protein [Thermodesulfobacteriota bacterium]
MKEPLKFGYPLLVSGYSNLLIQSGDRYVLRIFNSVSSVGLYSFGYNIARIIEVMLLMPLSFSSTPTIRKLESEPSEQKRFLRKSATFSYILVIFMALGISMFSKDIIVLLARQKEFWQSWIIVPFIAFSYAQHTLSLFLGWGMGMKNKPYHISGILLVSAAVNLGLNFAFVPYWGILGAAFATLISYIVWNGLKMYYSAKFYELHFDLKRLFYITNIGVGLYVLSLFVTTEINIWSDISIKALILFAYPLIFFTTNFFTEGEKGYMKKVWGQIRLIGIMGIMKKIRGENIKACKE